MTRKFAALLLLLLSGCGVVSTPKLLPDRLDLKPVPVSALPGWREDATQEALAAFQRSCDAVQKHADDYLVGEGPAAGQARYWKDACARGRDLPVNDAEMARHFFEQYFNAFRASNRGVTAGLFTGYYEPLLTGSRERTDRFTVPIYRLPDEKREGVPFYDRKDINAGVLAHKNLEVVWLEDPIEAFFLQIQGSGRIALTDGSYMRVGYAGRNDQPYVPIGKVLVERGELSQDQVSMQSIKQWLRRHPAQANEVMEQNPSYIFFREVTSDTPLGTQNVPLTANRSIAVDPHFVPLGTPVFLDMLVPATSDASSGIRRTLMIAQDTGGAIRGPVRADIFFGSGPKAEELAGLMKGGGEYYLLLPKDLSSFKP